MMILSENEERALARVADALAQDRIGGALE
jgi:hypothetical protein